ncbi:glycosyltransferase [Arhodomonas aquaeolei]|uniref:glycosyltransferase n=1 Tax=Arhodomonas aquaeolei TaxID=2369 RepID=UPI002167D093|nr:glycosyltransferase [Arhodomonas aquaeolei]MCS4505795.1 glycosyltransferase [Arhodomonas aquaeolei]
MEWVFWIAAAGAVYSYFLYPLVLLALPVRWRPPTAGDMEPASVPTLSVIITAYNAGALLRTKLDNTLALDYPAARREVIVASDASDDDTDAIARAYADRGVVLVRAPERRGKEHAQWLAVQQARGEVLVFSDVATEIDGGSLRRLASLFADPSVGAVSSEDRFVTAEGVPVGEGLYVRYEMALRRLEASRAGLVGLSGSFFAARAAVCRDWDSDAPSDFNTALNCARLGLRAVSDPAVIGRYRAISDDRREYQRKYRTVLRGITGLLRHPEVLDPRPNGGFAFQIWSHKPMRWAVPWCLLLALAANVALLGLPAMTPLYALTLALQALFYGSVLLGAVSPGARQRWFWVRVPYFFCQANLAIAHASVAYAGGRRMTVWQPSTR